MVKDSEYWIEKLGLMAHPEGGHFRQTYRSAEFIPSDCLPERFQGPRPRAFSTSIYYLLEWGQTSAFHRIKSDEMWHFYAGSSLTIYVIERSGRLAELKLGRDVEQGEAFQQLVEAGSWFGAEVRVPRSFSLVGCTVAPGFDFEDFELADRNALLAIYPQHRSLIEKLTR